MAQILTPGFVKWDGTKFVLEDVEGSDGEPGADGTSALVFRPGGEQTGNVYTSWSDLMAKRDTIDAPITIVVDDTLGETFVAEGTWDLNRNTKIAGYRGPDAIDALPVLTIPTGAQLLNPSDFQDIRIIGDSLDQPCILSDSAGFTNIIVNAYNAEFSTTNSSSAPLFQVDDFGTNIFNLYGNSRIYRRDSSTVPVIKNTTNSTYVEINLYDSTILDGYTIMITNGSAVLYIKNHSWGVVCHTNQPQSSCTASLVFPNSSTINISLNTGLTDGTIALGDTGTVSADQTRCFYYSEDFTAGANNSWSVILGGESVVIGANGEANALIGGRFNSINSSVSQSGVFVGSNSSVNASYGVVLGGINNTVNAAHAGIIAGTTNQVSGTSGVVIGGDSNSVEGAYSAVVGSQASIAGGQTCVVVGGNNNSTQSDSAVVVGGDNNSATSAGSIVLGGSGNSTQEQQSVIVGGNGNLTSGTRAVILGGASNSAQSTGSVILGGQNNVTSAGSDFSTVMGVSGSATRYAQFAHGADTTTQFGRLICANTIFNGGSAALDPVLDLEDGKAYAIRATVIANKQDAVGRAMWVNTILAHCTGGVAVIDNNNVTLAVTNGTSWSIAYAASGNFINATFTATGAGGSSQVRASVVYEWVEVNGGA